MIKSTSSSYGSRTHLKTVARQRAANFKDNETSDDDIDDDLPGSNPDSQLN